MEIFFLLFLDKGEKIHEWKHSGGGNIRFRANIHIVLHTSSAKFGVFNNVVQNLNICYIRTHLGNTSFSIFEISLLKKFLSNFNSKILRYVFSSNLFSIFNLVRTLSLLIFPRYSFSRNFILQTSKHLLLSFNFSSRMKEIKKIYFTKYFPFSSSKLLINQNYNQ